MSLFQRVPGRAALAAVSMCGLVLVAGQARASDGSSVTVNVVNPQTEESPRPATLSGHAHCDDEASGTWSVAWSFSAMRDGNDVVILNSSIPMEAWPSGAHLMPQGSMPDFSQWPLAYSSATSLHEGAGSATETLSFRLLPDGIGEAYNDGRISLSINNPCPAPEETSTTVAETSTTAATATSTTIEATPTTTAEVVEVATTPATTTTTRPATTTTTTTTAKKVVVAAATVQALPKTGTPSSRLAAIAAALASIGIVLISIDRHRRRI